MSLSNIGWMFVKMGIDWVVLGKGDGNDICGSSRVGGEAEVERGGGGGGRRDPWQPWLLVGVRPASFINAGGWLQVCQEQGPGRLSREEGVEGKGGEERRGGETLGEREKETQKTGQHVPVNLAVRPRLSGRLCHCPEDSSGKDGYGSISVGVNVISLFPLSP